jgi:hypothetical protein
MRDASCHKSVQDPHNVTRLQVDLFVFVHSEDEPLRNGEDAQIKLLEFIQQVSRKPHGNKPMGGAPTIKLETAMGGAIAHNQEDRSAIGKAFTPSIQMRNRRIPEPVVEDIEVNVRFRP